MKTSSGFNLVAMLLFGLLLNVPSTLFGQDVDMLQQASDLVHQAWNPGGDPPSDDERTDLLTKALGLAQYTPDHHLKGHRVKAILDIKAALFEIKRGDPDHKVTDYLHDADFELRTAISMAS